MCESRVETGGRSTTSSQKSGEKFERRTEPLYDDSFKEGDYRLKIVGEAKEKGDVTVASRRIERLEHGEM